MYSQTSKMARLSLPKIYSGQDWYLMLIGNMPSAHNHDAMHPMCLLYCLLTQMHTHISL